MDSRTPVHHSYGSPVDRLFGYIGTLKMSDRFFLRLALLMLFVSALWFLITVSNANRVEIASTGGSFIEGIVGTPRFINPVLAVTRADRDLAMLIYDGLMVLGPDGTLIPNIAESVTISDDGLTYNVILKKHVTFHDGSALTAKDIAFTVGRILDPTIASPLRANFDGVLIEQIGDYELNFVLEEPYSPFIENLTFGILPEHLWKDASSEEFPFSQLNTEPVGAGPYVVSRIVRTPSGIPESFMLRPHERYHNGPPKIETLTLKFFANEDRLVNAFSRGEVEAMVGLDQMRLRELSLDQNKFDIVEIPLPRTFALFFNQNKSTALRDPAARRALSAAIDRDALISDVLGGYGVAITGPLPPGFGVDSTSTTSETTRDHLEVARELLQNGGWKYNEMEQVWSKSIENTPTTLSFSIATVNNPTFEATVEFIRTSLMELGVPVTIKQFEQSDLTQSVIRPRDFEALFFGTQLGRSLDFFPFWHSSQRNDPGLNVSLYTNLTTDSILTEQRTSSDATMRAEALNKFANELSKENPALFLYTPELIYVFPKKVIGESFTRVSEPYERFATIHNWYINTESVWPIFKTSENESNASMQ